MFYEEKWINGVLVYRTRPTDDDWRPMTASLYSRRVRELMDDKAILGERIAHLEDLLAEITERI